MNAAVVWLLVVLLLGALISWALIAAGRRARARRRRPLPLGAVVITSPATFAAMQRVAVPGNPVTSVFGMPVVVTHSLPRGVESLVVDRAMLESVPPDPLAVIREDIMAASIARFRRESEWGWRMFPQTIGEAQRAGVIITGV